MAWRGGFLVLKRTPGSAVEILELVRLQRPEERGEAESAEGEGCGDEPGQGRHDHTFTRFDRSRTALAVTAMDELDMAIAAISGVA